MQEAGQGGNAWDWERAEVQEAVTKLQAQYDPQLLLLIGLLCLKPFFDQIPDDRVRLLHEKEAGLRLITVLGDFQLTNERGLRVLWVTLLGLVAGIWARESRQDGREAGPRLAQIIFPKKRKSPGG